MNDNLDEELYEGFSENLFCDNTGYCKGISCSNYSKCYSDNN